MNLLKKLMPFAGAVLSATPIGPLLPLINAILPNDAKLTPDTPVNDAMDTLASQPPNIQLELAGVDLGFEQEYTEQLRIVTELEKTGATTRPRIAMGSFYITSLITVLTVVAIFAALWTEGLEHADKTLALGGGIAVLCSPFILWVNAYIGARTREKNMRLAVGTGHPPESVATGLAGLAKIFK